MSSVAITEFAAIEAKLAQGDEAFRAAQIRGVYPKSLTRTADAIYVVADAGLLQIGGEPNFAAPIWRDGHHYIYAFAPTDRENVRKFAEQIDRAFLPRPQRDQPAIASGNRHPEISLPAVFDAFDTIAEKTGRNLASTVQLSATREMTTDEEIAARDGSNPTAPGHTRVSIRHLYHAGLWAAIRSGYRRGYNAEADHFIVSGSDDRAIAKSVEWVKEAIRHAAGYTKFTTDTSRVFDLRADTRHPQPYSESQIEDLFAQRLTAAEQAWAQNTFAQKFTCDDRDYRFTTPDIKRLAVKFGPSLKLNEELFDAIVRTRNGAPFDFEPSLDEAETLTTPHELIFYMHWLRERGRAAQLVPPNLGFKKRQAYPETRAALEHYTSHKMWPELSSVEKPVPELQSRVAELAAVARFFDGTLSIHSGSGKQPAVLASIGEATRGRLNYKISGELQLQLFDVLSGQPENSPERRLFERMVAVCERFAESKAFGDESALAAEYHSSRGAYLGNPASGRVDGNLFLVFWLGNMVGCRDEDGGFFKEKLDSLPAAVVEETRTRNANYIRWLATHLFGVSA
jgi:tagaturonate epimerase